jgi:hypothetical protein
MTGEQAVPHDPEGQVHQHVDLGIRRKLAPGLAALEQNPQLRPPGLGEAAERGTERRLPLCLGRHGP